jgi:hypothetical protein
MIPELESKLGVKFPHPNDFGKEGKFSFYGRVGRGYMTYKYKNISITIFLSYHLLLSRIDSNTVLIKTVVDIHKLKI